MVIVGIPTNQLLHTRAAQDLLDRVRQEGEAQGEATTAHIHALRLEQLAACLAERTG